MVILGMYSCAKPCKRMMISVSNICTCSKLCMLIKIVVKEKLASSKLVFVREKLRTGYFPVPCGLCCLYLLPY